MNISGRSIQAICDPTLLQCGGGAMDTSIEIPWFAIDVPYALIPVSTEVQLCSQ
jgi:hypothetical protein